MEVLQLHFNQLLRSTSTKFHRYLYHNINWNNRMIGIVGPRGVGKTTLVLQHIKEELNRDTSLYVIAEDIYFSTHNLVDLADTFVRMGGQHLFIDEIHKYDGWSPELKLIYDYHPNLHVVFTGSSVLDIVEGISDLSRRARMYHLQGMSFREYLSMKNNIELPVYTLESILTHHVQLPKDFLPLPHFAQYIKRGYYPFTILIDDYEFFLNQIVNVTLENDIPQYANLTIAAARKYKKLLSIIAQSAPFKPNFTQIAGQISVSRNQVADMCAMIEKSGLIAQLREPTRGIQSLGKVDKIYLDNTVLVNSLGAPHVDVGTIRETFFFNQLRLNHNICSSPASDFLVNEKYTFEVGGKSKKQRQIQSIDNAFVVKDDIETGYANIIPLWMFGLMY